MVVRVSMLLFFRQVLPPTISSSRNCFLLLNVNYIQPLGRFTYRKYVTDLYTGEKVERGVYKSSTFARDLNVSVGFGFPFYLGRKTNRKITA